MLLAILALQSPFALAQDEERTRERLAKVLQKFPAADANEDGKLTMEEFMNFRGSVRQKKGTRPAVAPTAPGIKRYSTQELASRMKAGTFQGVPYRFFVPDKIDESGKLPLILSLHGAGGKGRDNLQNLKPWNGVITDPAFQEKYPCFVVAPQSVGPWKVAGSVPDVTPELIATFPEIWQELARTREGFLRKAEDGTLGLVFALLDKIAAEYPVDEDRVYVLGHSMGGFGSFESIAMAPDRFAAAIPSAGGLSPWHDPAKFAHVPIWAFHGENDTTVPFSLSQLVFDRLTETGRGNMKLTRLGGVGHGASQYAFAYQGDGKEKNGLFQTSTTGPVCDPTEDVWEWLFRQFRKKG